MLLTCTGQLIVFECKSGKMESEAAKAREYTSYVLAGVYGKPVLVIPVGEKELNSISIDSDGKNEYKSLIEDYKKVSDAAERAGLERYDLNEIGNKIEKLYSNSNFRKEGGSDET